MHHKHVPPGPHGALQLDQLDHLVTSQSFICGQDALCVKKKRNSENIAISLHDHGNSLFLLLKNVNAAKSLINRPNNEKKIEK